MAYTELIAGEARSGWTVDLSEFATPTSVLVEISQNKETILKYMYPETEGYSTLTKTDDVYSFDLTTAQTENLRGLYDMEVTLFDGTSQFAKFQVDALMNVLQESV